MILHQIYSGNYVPNFIKIIPSFIENITKKHFGLFFHRYSVDNYLNFTCGNSRSDSSKSSTIIFHVFMAVVNAGISVRFSKCVTVFVAICMKVVNYQRLRSP